MWCAGGCPQHVVAGEMGVDERAQRLRVGQRGDAADRVAGGGADGVGIGAGDSVGSEGIRHLRGVALVVAAGQHEHGIAVRGEHQ